MNATLQPSRRHVPVASTSLPLHWCSNFGLSEIVVDVVIVIFQPRHGQSVVSHLSKFALEVLLEKINLDEVAKELVCFVFSRLRRSEIKTHLRVVICVTGYSHVVLTNRVFGSHAYHFRSGH